MRKKRIVLRTTGPSGRAAAEFDAVDTGEAKFVNLTPHPITIYDASGQQVVGEIPTSGKVLRVPEETVGSEEIGGYTVVTKRYVEEEIELPEPEPGVYYIVSLPALMALASLGIEESKLAHFLAPDTGPTAVRDASGKTLGVRQFTRIAKSKKLARFTAETTSPTRKTGTESAFMTSSPKGFKREGPRLGVIEEPIEETTGVIDKDLTEGLRRLLRS